MVVVADTSPINYLAQINGTDLLRKLYGNLISPEAVLSELQQPATPRAAYSWAADLPDWVQLRKPAQPIRAELQTLGRGESEAIEIALESSANMVLIEERKASLIAEQAFDLRVIGTLGILLQADAAGFVNGREAFQTLCTQTNFHWTPELKERFQQLLSSNSTPRL